jgi:hypothetical protein
MTPARKKEVTGVISEHTIFLKPCGICHLNHLGASFVLFGLSNHTPCLQQYLLSTWQLYGFSMKAGSTSPDFQHLAGFVHLGILFWGLVIAADRAELIASCHRIMAVWAFCGEYHA